MHKLSKGMLDIEVLYDGTFTHPSPQERETGSTIATWLGSGVSDVEE